MNQMTWNKMLKFNRIEIDVKSLTKQNYDFLTKNTLDIKKKLKKIDFH